MHETDETQTDDTSEAVKQASNAALASLLNLTFLPGIAFVWLLTRLKTADKGGIAHYHMLLGIGLNLVAAFALGVVSGLMLLLGGFDSAWTWVYLITYFTLVHTIFIVIAVWAMVRAWSGQRLRDSS